MKRTSVLAVAVAIAANLLATEVNGHGGRRLEVIVVDDQLAVHGYNSGVVDQGGNPRTYYNAMHDDWKNIAGGIVAATADLPGFDVFNATDSIVGGGSADRLQGAELTLTLHGAVKWDNPPASEPYGTPVLIDLLPSEVITIGNSTDFVHNNAPGPLTLASNISVQGEHELDLDYSVALEPEGVLYALQWVLSTDQPGISDSANIFTILSPDSSATNGLRLQSLHLEKYLSTPLIPGDYDRDGKVDVIDFEAWKEQFSHELLFAGAGADGSRDGIVGPEDFLIWRNHVGLASPLLDNSVSIPEPTSVVLLIAAFGALTLSSLEINSR